VRHRTVTARATDQDADLVGVGEQRPIPNADQASVEVIPEMKSEDGFRDRITEGAIIKHRWRTARDLLGRLKDEQHVPGKRCVQATQHASRRQENRDVAIVATSVHHTSVPRGVRDLILLLDRQGIDVGTERDEAAVRATAEAADYASPSDAFTNLQSEAAQRGGDASGRAVLLEGELGVGVQLSTKGHQLITGLLD
jgi:hypothetical protein